MKLRRKLVSMCECVWAVGRREGKEENNWSNIKLLLDTRFNHQHKCAPQKPNGGNGFIVSSAAAAKKANKEPTADFYDKDNWHRNDKEVSAD